MLIYINYYYIVAKLLVAAGWWHWHEGPCSLCSWVVIAWKTPSLPSQRWLIHMCTRAIVLIGVGVIIQVIGAEVALWMAPWEVLLNARTPSQRCQGALEQGNPPAAHIGPWMSWPIRRWDWFQQHLQETITLNRKRNLSDRGLESGSLFYTTSPSCYWFFNKWQ